MSAVVRLSTGQGGVEPRMWIILRGLPITRPSRIASDLLVDREDPEAVGRVVADALRGVYDYPGTFAETLAPHAAQLGLRRGDGVAVLRWLLDLVGDPATARWMLPSDPRPKASTAAPTPAAMRVPLPSPWVPETEPRANVAHGPSDPIATTTNPTKASAIESLTSASVRGRSGC
jgi:hypothetical protein